MPAYTKVPDDFNLLKSRDKADPYLTKVKDLIQSTFQRCSLTLRRLQIDPEFVQKCLDEAAYLGVPMHSAPDVPSFQTANATGAAIAYFTFSHIKSEDTKIFIATYTSLMVYIEDVYSEHIEIVGGFSSRFVSGMSQSTPVLEALATQLRRVPRFFGEMQTTGIVIGTLKWFNGLLHEYGESHASHGPAWKGILPCRGNDDCGIEGDRDSLPGCTCDFPAYLRDLSGNGEPYAMFTFPKDMDFREYSQAIPSIIMAFVYINDILSFYKEELAGENANYVSIIARHQNMAKLDVLKDLCERVVNWQSTSKKLLQGSGEPYDAFMGFSQGYVDYYTSTERYRLKEWVDVFGTSAEA